LLDSFFFLLRDDTPPRAGNLGAADERPKDSDKGVDLPDDWYKMMSLIARRGFR
jgi:hypothetical protein